MTSLLSIQDTTQDVFGMSTLWLNKDPPLTFLLQNKAFVNILFCASLYFKTFL